MAKKINLGTIEREIVKQQNGNYSNREKIKRGNKQFI